MERSHHLVTQGAAAAVSFEITSLQSKCIEQLCLQDQACTSATTAIDGIRDFVGSPEHILGNQNTKHGEIAEITEIGITNARCLLNRVVPSAFKHSARTGPIDYMKTGIPIQSKFHNGSGNTLTAIKDHANTYPGFPTSGGCYDIPRDQFQTIEKVLRGEIVTGISEKTIKGIRESVRHIEASSGRPFGDIIRGAEISYKDAQQGNIHEALNGLTRSLDTENTEIRNCILVEHRPGWQAVTDAAVKGAVLGAALRLGIGVWHKAQKGQNVFYGELTSQDWKELGVETAIGAAQGGVAAGAIFALTQSAGLAAPFAGAFVSAAMGVAMLAAQYHDGKISFDEFVEMGMLNCFEGAVVGLAAAAGQTLIPIPVIGALIGSLAGRIFVSLGKRWLEAGSTELTVRIAEIQDACMNGLNKAHAETIYDLERKFDALGNLVDAAFNLRCNAELRFQASVALAKFYGVDEKRMIHTPMQLASYMRA